MRMLALKCCVGRLPVAKQCKGSQRDLCSTITFFVHCDQPTSKLTSTQIYLKGTNNLSCGLSTRVIALSENLLDQVSYLAASIRHHLPYASQVQQMFQRATRGRKMPLAFHNTAFGRRQSDQTETEMHAAPVHVISQPTDTFNEAPPAYSEIATQPPHLVPSRGALRDLRNSRVAGRGGHDLPSPSLTERDTLAYLNRPLPATPTSPASVVEIDNNSAKIARSSATFLNRLLPQSPISSLQTTPASAHQSTNGDSAILNRLLPPTPTSSLAATGSSAEPSMDEEPAYLFKMDPETSSPAWLRRMRRRASYAMKWLAHYREK